MKIQLYASLKDYFGSDIDLTREVETPAEMIQQLISIEPSAATILKSCRFAVNDSFVNSTYKLTDTDVVSIIPPSSGG